MLFYLWITYFYLTYCDMALKSMFVNMCTETFFFCRTVIIKYSLTSIFMSKNSHQINHIK